MVDPRLTDVMKVSMSGSIACGRVKMIFSPSKRFRVSSCLENTGGPMFFRLLIIDETRGE